MTVLFEEDGYKVLALNGVNHPRTIVGFQNRNPNIPHLARVADPVPFFPNSFSTSRIKANFVSFIVDRNDWYLTDTAIAAAKVIKAYYAGTQIVPYGSSMGAFAAINLSGVLDSTYFIALSPVSTIFPPFVREIDDRRYIMDASVAVPSRDIIGTGALLDRKGVVLFDPFHRLDAAHAARLATLTDCSLVALPYAGHPCGPVLNRTYTLKRMLEDCAAGDLDVPTLRRTLLAQTSADLDSGTTTIENLPQFLQRCEADISQIRPIELRIALLDASTPRNMGPGHAAQMRRLAAIALRAEMDWGPQVEFRDTSLFMLCTSLASCGEAEFAEASVMPHLSEPRAQTFALQLRARARKP